MRNLNGRFFNSVSDLFREQNRTDTLEILFGGAGRKNSLSLPPFIKLISLILVRKSSTPEINLHFGDRPGLNFVIN